jgi:hypothetical protein
VSTRKHVFISHHHGDDTHVDKLTRLVGRGDYLLRNSSVRMKPANQRRAEQGRIKDDTIKRLLRMKMRWASTVVVLIGERTHKRPWVNWEIEQAARLGKHIVGVYLRGGKEANIPQALNDYGSAIVNWNAESVISAIEGTVSRFEKPDGALRDPVHTIATSRC